MNRLATTAHAAMAVPAPNAARTAPAYAARTTARVALSSPSTYARLARTRRTICRPHQHQRQRQHRETRGGRD